MDLSNLLVGLIGALVGAVAVLGGVWWQESRRAMEREQNLRSFLTAYHTEILNVWDMYSHGAGAAVCKLQTGDILSRSYATAEHHFPVYESSPQAIGHIKDDKLRGLIAATHIHGTAMANRIAKNNALLEKLKAAEGQEQALRVRAELVSLAGEIKAGHADIEVAVKNLDKLIGENLKTKRIT